MTSRLLGLLQAGVSQVATRRDTLAAGSQSAGRAIGTVISGTAVSIVLTVATSFVAPAYMSRADYGMWRAFTLYVAYAGVLHFGLLDGLLIRCAAQSREDCATMLRAGFAFLLLQQAVVVASLLAILSVVGVLSWTLVWLTLACAATNFYSFVQYALQALHLFKWSTIGTVSMQAMLLLLFLGGGAASMHVPLEYAIGATLVCPIVAMVLAGYPLIRSWRKIKSPIAGTWRLGKALTKIGCYFLVGNLLMVAFFNLDRLVASWRYEPATFALYAFPVSLLGSIYAIVGGVTSASFPYLAKLRSDELTDAFAKVRAITIAVWGSGLAAYFPFAFAVHEFLPEYVSAMPLLRILLLSVGPAAVVRSIHYNIYRVTGRRHAYISSNLLGLGILASMLVILDSRGGLLGLAWAALLASTCWCLWNEWSLRDLVHERNSRSALLSLAAAVAFAVIFVVITESDLGLANGCLIYATSAVASSWVLLWLATRAGADNITQTGAR